MSTDSTPPSDLIIAWAMPVNLAKLGARLVAYAETKATITTFRVVAGYKTQSTGRNLPEEIISMIASKIRDTVFKRKIKLWVKTSQCLANTCTTLSHVPQAELNSLAAIVTSNKMEDEEWLAQEFAEEAHEAHRKEVRQQCHALTNPKNKSKIAKSIKVPIRPSHHKQILISNLFLRRSSPKTSVSTPTSCSRNSTKDAITTMGEVSSSTRSRLRPF